MQKAVRKEKLKVIERPSSLRETLEWLRAEGDLIETDKPVNPDLELTGLQKHMDGGCPVLFNKVKGKPNHRLVTNLFGDMNVINKMFGWRNDTERTRKQLTELGVDIVGSTPKEFEAYIKSEIPKWTAVVKTSGAQIE